MQSTIKALVVLIDMQISNRGAHFDMGSGLSALILLIATQAVDHKDGW
jgi:hypothetical protein